MFSLWAVLALRQLARIMPFFRHLRWVRHISNFIASLFVIFWFNRRASKFNNDFWRDLLYMVQLFKVTYMLRFLMVELVYRQLRTFFCIAYPKVAKIEFVKQWGLENTCVMKVVNLNLYVFFMVVNLIIAYCMEVALAYLWAHIKENLRQIRTTSKEVSSKNRKRQKTAKLSAGSIMDIWPGRSGEDRKEQESRKNKGRKQENVKAGNGSLFNIWPLRSSVKKREAESRFLVHWPGGSRHQNIHPTPSTISTGSCTSIASIFSRSTAASARQGEDRQARGSRSSEIDTRMTRSRGKATRSGRRF